MNITNLSAFRKEIGLEVFETLRRRLTSMIRLSQQNDYKCKIRRCHAKRDVNSTQVVKPGRMEFRFGWVNNFRKKAIVDIILISLFPCQIPSFFLFFFAVNIFFFFF